jgi:hypothetical protein
VEPRADVLVARLEALREGRMRVAMLVEALREGEPTSWIAAFDELVIRSQHFSDPGALLALDSLIHAIPELPYATCKALYEAAQETGRPAIARLFLTTSPESDLPAQLKRELQPERPLRPTGRPLTLGERKALARTHRRDQLLLLLRDPHPAVVAILLDNPHVTEADIVKVAAARPAAPEALTKIAAHPRWSVRHAIKRALVLNPAMPLADAIRIATTLAPGELSSLASDPALPEPLRTHAAQLGAQRGRRPTS